MTQYNKERHAAAMLVHQLGSGIKALHDMDRNIALENLQDLQQSFLEFCRFIVSIQDIQIAMNDALTTERNGT